MRLLHCSDLHLDLAPDAPLAEDGTSMRMLDFVRAWEEAAELAVLHGADAFIFCGDAFMVRRPSPIVLRAFAEPLRGLANKGMPIVVVSGHHDPVRQLSRDSAYHALKAAGLPLVIVDRVDLYRVDTASGPLEVVGVPAPATRQWLEEGDLGRGDPTLIVAERLVRAMREAAAQEWEGVRIIAGHLPIVGARYSSERLLTVGDEPAISALHLALPGVRYAALGHIHECQQVNAPLPAWYSGSLQAVDFSEEGQEKVALLVEIGETVQVTPLPVWNRRRVTVSAEIPAGCDAPTDAVVDAIHAAEIDGAIVRVVVSGHRSAASQLDMVALHRALSPAFSVHGIKLDLEGETRRRTEQAVETMTPLDALRVYLTDKVQEPERTERLLRRAEQVMEELTQPGGEKGLR
jgi:exonuclease SbcD